MRVLLLGLLLPAFACSNATATDDVLLLVETTRQLYVIGDTVTVIASNVGEVTLGYGFCRAELEIQSGQRWINSAVIPPQAACVDILTTIAPGERDTVHFALRSDMSVGIYRFRLPFHVEGTDAYESKDRVSNPFWVRGAP